jgi:hypothetical protein
MINFNQINKLKDSRGSGEINNCGYKNVNQDISLKKRIIFSIVLSVVIVAAVILVGELSIRIIDPQVSMYPRWKFSEKYGAELIENAQMVHERPGRWKFIYTINKYQYRGKLTPISGKYDRENIIVLGDSYSFGTGVNDGEEFASVMAQKLKSRNNVINLSVAGWGLTQHIRRYYEFGQLYFPKIVILQFCNNDPRDNFTNKVVFIENGEFQFQNSNNSINWVKKYFSDSIIQKSQIYNLIRDYLYRIFTNTQIEKEAKSYKEHYEIDDKYLAEEQFYNELLELFVKDLNQKGIKVIMISVDNELDVYPNIKAKVSELNSNKLIDYLEVMSWLRDVSDYGTPEGHAWGEKAHKIIGKNLAETIRIKYLRS